MTINEAMNLLGLNPGFTDEELNKKYKEQMRKWHPDICNDPNAEKMAKKINEARYVLKSYKGTINNNSYGYNYNIDLKIKKTEYFNYLQNIAVGAFDINLAKSEDFDTINFATLLAMTLMQANFVLENVGLLESLREKYIEYREKILNYISDYVISFCSSNGLKIYFHDGKEFIIEKEYSINVENGFSNVYNELQKIKNEKNVFKRAYQKIKTLLK